MIRPISHRDHGYGDTVIFQGPGDIIGYSPHKVELTVKRINPLPGKNRFLPCIWGKNFQSAIHPADPWGKKIPYGYICFFLPDAMVPHFFYPGKIVKKLFIRRKVSPPFSGMKLKKKPF